MCIFREFRAVKVKPDNLRHCISLIFVFQLRSIFVVLSDDMFRQILRNFEKGKRGPKPPASGSVSTSQEAAVTSPAPGVSAPQAPGGSTPPPASTPPASGTEPPAPPRTSKSSKSRNQKRGASSDASIELSAKK